MNTLRRRLIFSHLLPVVLLAFSTGLLLIFVLEQRVILVNLSSQLTRQASLLSEVTRDMPQLWGDPEQAQAFVDRFSGRTTAQIMLLDAQGFVLASSDPADAVLVGRVLEHPDLDTVRLGANSVRTDYSQRLGAEIADIMVPALDQAGQVVGMVRLTNLLSTVVERFQTLRSLILQVLALGLGLGGLAALSLAWSLERPVEHLTRAITGLAGGDEKARVTEEGPQEFRLLATAFNDLVQQLRILRLARRQLLANLVHELGRPLGALRSASQALLSGADQEPELRADLLQGMDGELKNLQRLLDDLVGYYDRGLGMLDLDRQMVGLDKWLAGLAALWGETAREKGLAWDADIATDLPQLAVDADRLSQAVGNLIHNAIKFTPRGDRVALAAGREGEQVWIRVSDSGRGIDPADQAGIFEPFFRARGGERLPEGMGLGLAIARDLVVAHGGRLEVDSQPGEGSRFTIWLPIR